MKRYLIEVSDDKGPPSKVRRCTQGPQGLDWSGVGQSNTTSDGAGCLSTVPDYGKESSWTALVVRIDVLKDFPLR
ncbi:hypothetical protein KC347_g255 [Hortaea werneckii]|nr:hypothetical protein KC347_g255 [Hortaea werneckii]